MINKGIFLILLLVFVSITIFTIIGTWRRDIRKKPIKARAKSFDYDELCRELSIVKDNDASKYMPYFEEKFYVGYNFQDDNKSRVAAYSNTDKTIYFKNNILNENKNFIDYVVHHEIGHLLDYRVNPEIRINYINLVVSRIAGIKQPAPCHEDKDIIKANLYRCHKLMFNVNLMIREGVNPKSDKVVKAVRELNAHAYAIYTWRKRNGKVPNTFLADIIVNIGNRLVEQNKRLTKKYTDK